MSGRVVVCWILAGFLVGANAAGYLAIRHDKRSARAQHRANPPDRIPERWLWTIAFFGGFLGEAIAMGRHRHKTRKLSFQFVLAVASLVSTLVWAGWLSVLGCLGGLLAGA